MSIPEDLMTELNEQLPTGRRDTGEPEEPAPEPSDEIVESARRLGWVPKDEFRGRPETWKPAEEFVTYGKERNSVLNERLSTMERRNSALEKRLQETELAGKEAATFYQKVTERAYENERTALLRQKRDGIAAGDGDAVIAAEESLATLQKPAQSRPAETQPAEADLDLSPEKVQAEWEGWLGNNSWVNADEELGTALRGFAIAAYLKDKTLRGKELFDLAAVQVKKAYPDRFRAGGPAGQVEGSSRGTGVRGSTARSFDGLPPAAKETARRLLKMKYIKSLDQYAAEYWATN